MLTISQLFMPRDLARWKITKHNWYLKNKGLTRYRTINRLYSIQQILNDFKTKTGCIKCGEKDPRCLDYHHIDYKSKKYAISVMLQKTMSIKKILDEIKKCEILCSNCHRIVHYKENKYYPKWFKILKSTLSCIVCGFNTSPAAIDFHHKNEINKFATISQMLNGFGKPKKKYTERTILMKEIEKCNPLCANCHRKKHYKGYKKPVILRGVVA